MVKEYAHETRTKGRTVGRAWTLLSANGLIALNGKVLHRADCGYARPFFERAPDFVDRFERWVGGLPRVLHLPQSVEFCTTCLPVSINGQQVSGRKGGVPPERDEAMLRMRRQGATVTQIARTLGLSHQAVDKRLRRIGDPKRNRTPRSDSGEPKRGDSCKGT